jgi:PKD repeat protein
MGNEITVTMNSDKNIVAHYDENDEKLRPVAKFTYTPDSPLTGETVHFDASESSDEDGEIVSYEWDFDYDGNQAHETTTELIFKEPGEYDVTLTVTDNDGLTDDVTKTIVVRKPDTPEIYYNLTIDAENAGEYATTVPEPGVHKYLEGSEVEVFANILVNCIGLIEFSHWSGNDIDGSTNPVETLTMDSDKSVVAHFILIEPENEPPKAHFLYEPIEPVAVNQPICFKSDSKDSDGEIVSYEWDFGDGNTSSGNKIVMHSYELEGTYTVCLKVTDDDGADNTYCEDIKVVKNDEEELGVIHGFVMTINNLVVDEYGNVNPTPYPPEIIPVEDATVTAKPLRNDENQVTYTAKTDKEGYFRMENVKPDVYEVLVTKEGYYGKPLLVKVFPGAEQEPLKILIIRGEPRE